MALQSPLTHNNLWRQNMHDIFFPRFCYGCYARCTYLCDTCFGILRATEPRITITPQPSYLVGTIACCRYQGLIKELIHALKYQGVEDIALPLARLIENSIRSAAEQRIITPPVTLIPIPLHPRRERERGFNQNISIARHMTTHEYQLHPVLVRRVYTKSQTRLTKHERAINVKNAFSVLSSSIPQTGTILLIDDVATTSATLIEAAACLTQKTHAPVWGCVLAYDEITA